ncbi:metal-dependent hydrolase [Roseovarius sp. CAU 1744]
MITAHLPAGYLTGRTMARAGPVLWAAVAGGVAPDIDLVWFYLIDSRAFHHHHYWVHVPAFWIMSAAVLLPLLHAFRPGWLRPASAFLAAVLVHLCLDGIAGGIKWLWPFSDRLSYLLQVPARHAHWVLNFVLHPVFLLEILIWAAALWALFHPATYRKGN